MNPIIRLMCGGIFLAAASSACLSSARATPFAGVNNAVWSVRFFNYETPDGVFQSTLPDGVSFSCFGGASAFGAPGCTDHASLTLTNASAADIILSLSHVSGFTLTNTTNADILGIFDFRTDFSAFNPGGSPIGASVDDPLLEYAAFSSSVFGPGTGDSHSCNTITGPVFITPDACGVQSPDSSQGEFDLGPLAAGETLSATYRISIQAEAIGVPEPTTLALFGSGLIGAVAMRRRKKNAA